LLPLLHLLLWLLFDTAALVSFLLCWWFSFALYTRWRSLRSCPYRGLRNSLGGQVSGVGRYLSRSEIFRGISCEELSREGFFLFSFPLRPCLSDQFRCDCGLGPRNELDYLWNLELQSESSVLDRHLMWSLKFRLNGIWSKITMPEFWLSICDVWDVCVFCFFLQLQQCVVVGMEGVAL
jgi:hypothetical protein